MQVSFSGRTCGTRLVLVLSSFSTASACAAGELVAVKLVVGLNLCLQKGSSFIVVFPNLTGLRGFSVQTVWSLEARKELTSQSDYVLLNL